MKKLKDKGKKLSDLKKDYQNLLDSVNLEEEYNKNKELYDKILQNKDVIELLRYYTNKGLASNFNTFIPGYRDMVIRLLQTDKKDQIVKIWKNYLPKIF